MNKKEIWADYRRIYRIRHPDRIREREGKKHNCFCGGKYTTHHKAVHFRTKKHKIAESRLK